ncbi:discoidin domain-containing protein, partial [Thomasclavelia spiroformis]
DGAAVNVIDGNINTYWHSTWGNANINLPQSVTLKLDKTKTLYKLAYTPRQNSNNGRIKEYEIATSIDGNEFTTVASGQWVDSKDIQYVEFIPTDANYIKITATEAYGGGAKQSCNIAEIGLFEYSDGVINVGDKTALTNLVNTVKDLDTSIYAKPTVDNLINAINEAQKLLDTNLVSQQMLDNAYTKLINAKTALINISKATNALAKLDELKEENYTPESWQIFINELTTLKEQLNDITSSREVLDIVVKADYIESQLIKAEITDTNKTALKIAIDIASLISEESLENVIPVIVDEFKAALSEANEVYNNTSATQKEVNNAFDRLANAMQKLEFYKGNKTKLIEAIEEANSKQEEDYTANSWKALQEALQEANKILADENVMQKEVDEATNKLQEALDNLVTTVDKSLLQVFVEYVSGLDSNKYTEATWKAFETELTEANVILKDANATQEQVDNAYNQLVKAYLDLRLIPDKSLLEELINKAEGLNVANYTKATFDGLTKALNEAKAVYENPNATQKEVDSAKATLEKAINNLEVTPINNGDTTSVKTGDSSYITTSLGLIMTSGLIASYLKKKKKS